MSPISEEIMIKAQDLHRSYGNLEVLKGVDLDIKKGEIVSIVGASGAGKTTLLQILGTLEKSDQGSLILDGTEVNKLSDKKLSNFRNKEIGFIFQFHHLLPEFNALENICLPGFIANRDKEEVEQKARELLGFLGLTDRENHQPNELSGGEQQRVAVARSLINDPAVVLADEPSGNLDSKTSEELHQLFFDLREKFQQTFVIVTHNEGLAKMADRELLIRDGVIIGAVETEKN